MEQKQSMVNMGAKQSLVLDKLETSEGIFVQCRLPNGADVHVPLKAIFALFQKELSIRARLGLGVK